MKPQRTVDFKKVQWADFWYQNQDGHRTRTQQFGYSVHGIPIKPDDAAMYHAEYPGETQLQRATRLGILDRWSVHCTLNISANRTLHYVGEKAKQIWKAYNAHIYGNR